MLANIKPLLAELSILCLLGYHDFFNSNVIQPKRLLPNIGIIMEYA